MATPFHNGRTQVNAKTTRAFRVGLLRWYRRHRRDLPWRRTRDPYAIWISEIMLQQTRVETVVPYYRRWLRAFPTVESLARAPYPRVLKLWEGLGYYRRARNLHRSAQIVTRAHGGDLPREAAQLRHLPGIGRYTAGAIASIAFDERAPLVDGNVARVLARVFGIGANVKRPATLRTLWALAEALLPARGCGDFNQAIMELGALVCTPGQPDCPRCPLRRVCRARARGTEAELPNRGPQRRCQSVIQDAAWIRRGGRILLRRRPSEGLLADLWELPLREGRRGRLILTLAHTVTHRRITLRVFECDPPPGRLRDREYRWITARQLARLPLAAAHRRAVSRLLPARRRQPGRALK